MSNLPTRAPSDAATLTTAAYRELVAALSGRVLTAVQAVALRQILLQLHVVARLLDEADAPDAPAFIRQDSYRGGLAMTAVDAFRRQLLNLTPVAPTSPPQQPRDVDHHDMRFCPMRHACDVCGAAHDDLALTTADTPLGVACMTICPACVDSAEPMRLDSLSDAIRRVSEHHEHLGVDVAAIDGGL